MRIEIMNATQGVPVDELITTIKAAIRRANISDTDTSRDLQVTSAYLKLNTIATATAGGRLDFRVPFIGMKLTLGRTVVHQDTHTMEMTLIPDVAAKTYEIRDGSIENVFVEAIETVRAVMARAAEGDDPFILKDSNIELSFAVTEVGTISLGAEGELKDEITHTLRLSLALPLAPHQA